MKALKYRGFGKWLDHESGALTNGIIKDIST
jgi:hypothetical protein